MFDRRRLGEAVKRLASWGEPRGGVQEMDADSKSEECSALNR